VLGLGYIGLPFASTLATHGVRVIGVDTDPRVLDVLRSGGVHIHEPGLRSLVDSASKTGNLTIAGQPEEADAFVIAVPTPFREGEFGEYETRKYKLADLGAVTAAAESIVPHLRHGNLVVLESTSPPRTTSDLLAPILERSGLRAGHDFHLCYSPERVLPGQILQEMISNARVVGGVTPESARLGHELYATFVKGEIVETDAVTAELVKLMENTFRDVNIGLANEFSRVAERAGVDVWEAIRLANRHPRVKILSPGPGVGGHCIGVDPWFLVESAPDLTPLIYSSRQVNDAQPGYVAAKVRQALGSLARKKIAALGLAYKPDVDDLRESPAVEVVRILQSEGARVKAWEPFAPATQLAGIELSSGLSAALAGAELVLLLVNHTQFRDLRPADVARLSGARIIVDAVNGWSGPEWLAAGFQVFPIGVGNVRAAAA
jgi:UDP-N-acetyl-D-mannosaminuronic acid dehydrogenase